MDLLYYIKDLGNLGLDIFWLPIILWTAMGLVAIALMKFSEKAHSVFQYHGRIALLCALPAGVIFSMLNHWFNSFMQSSGQIATKFIVIQSPISVSGTVAAQTFDWTEPAFISGLLLSILILISIILVVAVAANFIRLHSFAKQLEKVPLANCSEITRNNIRLSEQIKPNIKIAFTELSQVPFTFGSHRPVIVIPDVLKQDNPDKLNMALRHELMHIKHRDFSINTLMMLVKAVFWFHPLIHKLYEGLKEYREISCDHEVLSDNTISKKFYAQLLFELANKRSFESTPAVSMSVNPSTLKKRIQVMSSQKHQKNMFKTSVYTMLVSALFLSGIMACSDIQSSGVTNKDIESVQSEMVTKSADTQPLYVVNGEIMEASESKDILSRLKPEYIYSISVLKGDKALEEYGSKGENGVVELQVTDTEKAFDDLLASAPEKPKESYNPKEDYFVVVDKMPQIKGGMQSLQSRVKYPEEAREAGVQGRVLVQFIVNKQGKVENAKIVKGIGSGADEEALRVIKETEFIPGMQNEQPVRVQYSLPIMYKLAENKTE